MVETIKANFTPPKSFFVNMMVRDIELKDAILDLIDNCVDGIQRQRINSPVNSTSTPYVGYKAELTINADMFSILDNCGGISKKIAEEEAFRLGRSNADRDKAIQTVGMYGIGMKRAIFKMGTETTVTSKTNEDSYFVKITEDWLQNDDDFHLPLTDIVLSPHQEEGTEIKITKLHKSVSRAFNPLKGNFVSELSIEISKLFSIILKKGFTITINGENVLPKEFELLVPKDFVVDHDTIKPFLFNGKIGNVEVDIAVGFYRPLAGEEEIEKGQDIKHSSDNAGWSVVCNDRLVLHSDKTHLTGWGTGGTPNYHTQFISISGIILFKSANAMELPLNTTKRGVDLNSEIYMTMLDVMREGLRHFIDFTNRWKGRLDETIVLFESTERKGYTDAKSAAQHSTSLWSEPRKFKSSTTSAKKFNPNLPIPKKNDSHARISFTKPVREIEIVKKHLFEDMELHKISASEVGETVFRRYLNKTEGE